ncbi:GNAT family N-acetyltransferase [Arcanobacterium haemolyticum]|nr:GNAT family N-acetyltransferase [Arcanobacterium haemolyticum]
MDTFASAQEMVASWSIDEVVGRLFCVSVGHHANGAYGFSDSLDETARLVHKHHIGGVCYFPTGEDGANPAVVSSVVEKLRSSSTLPLLVTIDQEGGLVTRMREPATRWPSAMAQGASRTPIALCSKLSGMELQASGIDMTFAPVADVNSEPANPVIGIRSAASTPTTVGTFVREAIAGFHSAGILTCAKHFPGHGATAVDSHFGLPVFSASHDDWRHCEALPFIEAIAAGVDAIMIGHLAAPELDPSGAPATFSSPIVTGLLRRELGFDGVIVTDALDMAGATGHGTDPADLCLNALTAGVDLLLMPRDPERCVQAVIDAVRSGLLNESRLRESAARVLALRITRESRARSLSHDVLVRNRHIAARTVTSAIAWRDPRRRFRLEQNQEVDILADPLPPSIGRGVEDLPRTLAHILRNDHHVDVSVRQLGEPTRPDAMTLVVIRDAWRFPEVAQQLRNAHADCVVAARSPYDARLIDKNVPVLLTYGDIPGCAAGVAACLISGIALGSLPIDLPGENGDILWPSRPRPHVSVRPYGPGDYDEIGRICVRTGASGNDASGLYSDDELLPSIYAYPYLKFAPELAYVVDVDGQAAGYILGVDDSSAFHEWWKAEWSPWIADRFSRATPLSELEQALVSRALHPELPAWRSLYPAEFHIDLLPIVQGEGWGRELIDQFVTKIRERGVRRVAIGVGATNARAYRFYRSLGFAQIQSWKRADGEIGGHILGLEAEA